MPVLRFRHSQVHGQNYTPIMLFLPYPRSCTKISCISLLKSLIIRIVYDHHILLVHFINVTNYSVVRVIRKNIVFAFSKFRDKYRLLLIPKISYLGQTMVMRSSAVHQIELHCQIIYTRLIFDLVQEEFEGR